MAAAAARPQIGSVGEFDPKKEDFYTYEMRLKIWMSVNKIDDDDKGKVLLALVGPEAFEIIMNQTAPDDPSTKPYADLVKIAKDYYDVTKNALTEQQEFRARQQRPGEGISDYILALKRLSRHCNYGDQLNENLRDTFVGGLSSKQIKQKLFLIKDLTWAKAQSEALAMEAANRDAQTAATGGEQQTINKVSGKKKFFKPKKMEQNKESNNNCNRCTGKHPEHKCPHKQSRCFKWSERWLLRFHPDKCKTMHIGNNNSEPMSYKLKPDISGMDITTSEKDVGVIIDNKLSFDMHIAEKVNKANSVVGAIRRSFEYLDKDTFKKLYTALVRPHLEYANAVWNPYKKKDVTTLENVQRRATKMVPGLGDKSVYEDRLKDLRLPTLTYRRI